jgi:hypothetical protein
MTLLKYFGFGTAPKTADRKLPYQPRLGFLGSLPDMVLPLGGAVFAYDGMPASCLFIASLGGSILAATRLGR